MRSFESGEPRHLIDPDEQQEPESNETFVASGLSRRTKLARQLLKYHNDDPHTLLTAEEEQTLSKTIQDGLLAEKFLEAATPQELGRYKDQTAQLMAARDAGREAERKLFECNILLAHFFAYKSMNIGSQDPTAEAPGTFGDIRKLRSPRASAEDRMQIALTGLARAVTKFKPRVNEKTKKPTRFSTMAAWEIHADLAQFIHDNEVGGTRLPTHIRDKLSSAYKDPSQFTDEELDKFAAIRSRSETIPFDELDLGATAPEEHENDWDGIPSLRPEDVIADPDDDNDPFHTVALSQAREKIEEVFTTLSEREAGVIRLRFGLTEDGQPRTLDEIGAVYGVTRERVRQIESKTMSKLRNPQRANFFRGYFDEDLRSQNNRLTDNPYHLPQTIETVVNVRTPEPIDYHRDAVFNPAEPIIKAPSELESWQADSEDTWDAPLRQEPPSYELLEVAAEKLFNAMMKYVNPADFKHGGPETVAYPSDTITDILENCGKHLLPEHIETYWNTQLEKLVNRLKRANKKEFNLDRVSLLFSALLAATMKDTDAVELDVPDKLNKKLNFFASHLKQGSITINGDLGNFTAYSAAGTPELHIRGSIGDYGAAYSNGFVSIRVDGNTGEQFGHGVSDEVTLDVRGQIKSLAVTPDFKGTIVAKKVRRPTIGHKDLFVEKIE